nr:hypothetical protein [Klebsiella michiganensis]UGK55354.1 Hypothetical protein [Raoultella ornithinolytica]UMW96376.1 hypothetical protein [Raoultella ornithinolytica]UUW42145.1 hypothetical protein [Klebsiella michiganensis]UWX38092.1 hypothetical protein KJK04_p0440 [Klebsiella quasipneumoniae]
MGWQDEGFTDMAALTDYDHLHFRWCGRKRNSTSSALPVTCRSDDQMP